MRLLAVTQWIDVGVASRQQDAIQSFDHGIDVIAMWNQADVHRSAAGSFNGFAVVTRKIEAISGVFNAHRDADTWSCLHSLGYRRRGFPRCYHNASRRQNASLTYIETSSYSLVKE